MTQGTALTTGALDFRTGDVVQFLYSFSNQSGGPQSLVTENYFPQGFDVDEASFPGTMPASQCFYSGMSVPISSFPLDFCARNWGTVGSGVGAGFFFTGIMTQASPGFYANTGILTDGFVDQALSSAQQIPDTTTGGCSIITSGNIRPGSSYTVTLDVDGAATGFYFGSFMDLLLLTGMRLETGESFVPVSALGNFDLTFGSMVGTDDRVEYVLGSGVTITPNFYPDARPYQGTGVYYAYGTGVDGRPFSCTGLLVSQIDSDSFRLTKLQRNVTQDIPLGGGFTGGMIDYASGDVIEFLIEFENTTPFDFSLGGSSDGSFVLWDTLPYGFCAETTGLVRSGGQVISGSLNNFSFTGVGVGQGGLNNIFGSYALSGTNTFCAMSVAFAMDLGPFATGYLHYTGTLLDAGQSFVTNTIDVYDTSYSMCIDPNASAQFLQTIPTGNDFTRQTGFDATVYYDFSRFLQDEYFFCDTVTDTTTLTFSDTILSPSLSITKYHLAAIDSGFTQGCQHLSCAFSSDPLSLTDQTWMTYRIEVINSGAGPAFDVVVEDLLPPGFIPMGSAPSGCTYTQLSPSPIRYSLSCLDNALPGGGPSALGATWLIDVVGTITTTGQFSSYTNTASVSTTSTGACQLSGGCQSNATSALVARIAQMQIVNQFAQMQANPGDIITFTLTYTNIGQQTGVSVELFNALPQGLIYLASTGDYTGFDPTTESWQIGDVVSGSGGSIIVTAQIPATFAGSSINNTASIYEGGAFDANASDTLLVSSDLGIAIQKSYLDQPIAGQPLTFVLQFTNNRTTPLSSYSVSDMLPPSLSYISGSMRLDGVGYPLNDPLLSGGRLVWECGSTMPAIICPLSPGQTRQLQFDVLVY